MNTFTKKSKTLILLLFVMVAMLAMPITAMAAPEDNITVEFRYTPGNEYTIPQSYTFAGRTFVLLSQAAPVLESTLPATRTYTYNILGDLTEADMLLIDDSAKINFTPKIVVLDREIEKYEHITKHNDGTVLTNNDVDELGHGIYKKGDGSYKAFPIDPNLDPGVVNRPDMKVSSVKYNVELWEALDGTKTTDHVSGAIPAQYSADVVYKGLEDYEATEYFTVDATYSTEKTEGYVDQYVIVATYEPTDLVDAVAPAPTPAAPGTDTTAPATTPTTVITDGDTPLLDAQSGDNIVQNIADGNVPLSNTISNENSWSLLSLVLSVIAVCIGVFAVMQAYINRRSTAEIAEGKSKPNIILNVVACVAGIATLIVWLVLDAVSLDNSYVWVNNSTLIVGLLLAVTVIVFVIATVRSKGRTLDESIA